MRRMPDSLRLCALIEQGAAGEGTKVRTE